MSETKFWIVWSPQGISAPRRRHADIAGATKAAEEMSARFVGQQFYVMEAKTVSKSVMVQTVSLSESPRSR